jgi:hypothetical protein
VGPLFTQSVGSIAEPYSDGRSAAKVMARCSSGRSKAIGRAAAAARQPDVRDESLEVVSSAAVAGIISMPAPEAHPF